MRTLPPKVNPEGEEYDPEEDEPIVEPRWPILQISYKMLIKFLEMPTFSPQPAKSYLTMATVHRLIALLDSEDPRERDLLKTCLHRVYGKMVGLRAGMREAFRQYFDETSYGMEQHCLAELLEILGSIINGFAIPLKDEHVEMLKAHLLPLHKCHHFSTFASHLLYCVVQFVEKDPVNLGPEIIRYLLHCWPKQASNKEVLFLGELEDILEVYFHSQGESIQSVSLDADLARRFLKRFAACCSCLHFQVFEA